VQLLHQKEIFCFCFCFGGALMYWVRFVLFIYLFFSNVKIWVFVGLMKLFFLNRR
jgi:hypothetical protein